MRWLLVLLLLPLVSAQQFVAVVPDLPGPGPGDEGFALQGEQDWQRSGWSVTDGEGTFWLPAGIQPGGEPFWIVGNETLWQAYQGPDVDALWPSLRLGNDGDDLHLMDPHGETKDSFLYGDKGDLPGASAGRMFTRDNHGDPWANPWDRRIGQTQWQPLAGTAQGTFYASPDSSFATITELIDSADTRLVLHVYEFRLLELADRIVQRMQAAHDLQVHIAIDATPVGQESHERRDTAEILHRIEQAGGSITLLGDDRYRNHHLKVLVADDAVAIQSENWVASGVPVEASWGNRGWGVVLASSTLADAMETWLAEDRGGYDSTAFDLDQYDPLHRPPPDYAAPRGNHRGFPASPMGEVHYQIVWSPEHTADPEMDPILAAMQSARERIWWQQLDIRESASNRLGWEAEDPYFQVLRQKAEAGVDVRIMAAAPFHPDDTGNQDTMQALAAYGVQTCTFDHPDMRLHNKGGIFDDTVVVGSMNGNHHSRSENRELSVVLDGDVAQAPAALFESDWLGCEEGLFAPGAPVPMLLASLLLVALLRCSRGSPISSSP